jgi:serine/threonine protein kinase/WD40 repeat protein
VADDPPPDPARTIQTRTTAVGAADSAGTMQMPSVPIGHAPPAMPSAELPTGHVVAVASGPPPMPGSAAPSPAGPPRPAARPDRGAVPPTDGPTVAGTPNPTHLPPAMPPARYELGHEIARGGMGRVVDATDTLLGRLVAFKEALSTDSDTLRRFQREIRITARLEHPSIVPVHDTGASSNGAPFYVMRKVSGRPLERLVATADSLGQRLALIPHIVDSAQAIAHAHERGIVHRDIKPSNILIGELGETVVIDWGLAKVIGEAEELSSARPQVDLDDSLKTRAGIVYGTPGFMAPEQLRGAPVNAQCDVYALGATLYHLLSRKPPHYAKTADEMMKAAVAAAPTPIIELVAGVPPDLATIVDKALAHDPAVRYQDARALAQDLQRFLTGQLVRSHHYSPREKLVRFIKQNRGMSAAIAALLVIGSFAILRIVIERNRADTAAVAARHAQATAESERETAVRRTEELTLTQARYNVELNPTKAIAMIKPLAAKDWREVRSIAAAARASGVAWSARTSKQTLSLEMSRDGKRALSAGSDGVVRIHDLVSRTTRQFVDLQLPVMARFADEDRQIVTWHDDRLAIFDTRTGKRKDVTVASPIAALEVVGITAYWVDAHHALWQLDLAGVAPLEILLEEPVRQLVPSPNGRWLALSGESHLYLFDRTQPVSPLSQVMLGVTQDVSWAADSQNFAALIDQYMIDVELEPAPQIVHRQTVGKRQFVAHGGGRTYSVGPTGVAITSRSDRTIDATTRKPLSGAAVGLVAARGETMVAGAASGLTVISPDGDCVLPLRGARIERVVASPHSPYVIAQLEGRLLVWDLDEVQPRRLTSLPTGRALFATSGLVIAGGTPDQPAQAIDVATGTARPLGSWQGLRAVTASHNGQALAMIDDARQLHVISPGHEPVELDGEIDFAGFATDDQLVVATVPGAVDVYDLATRRRTPLIAPRTQLIGLAWGRGQHPWIAAVFTDGMLWRKNLVTGQTANITRVPALDAAHLELRDSKLLVSADGTVSFLHDHEIHAWRPDGALVRIATAPKPLVDFGEAGPAAVAAFAGDGTIYTVGREPPYRLIEALPAIDVTSAAMSPETGLLVVLEHGAIDVLDPLVHQHWTLAQPSGVTFDNLAISGDGRRILAHTAHGLLTWSIALPQTPEATVTWLDAMTNAVDDLSPGGLGWRGQ